MRLDAIRLKELRRAIQIYLAIAYPDGGGPSVTLQGDDQDLVSTVLPQLVDESRCDTNHACRRYVLRLGNPRYPFMKIVLQEYLIRDEFFLSVDGHDDVITPGDADEHRELDAIRAHNLDVKQRIEMAWLAEQLPTQSQLKGLIGSLLIAREAPNGQRVLVVDDEREIADSIELLLRAKGFEVERAGDGREALSMVDAQRHQLVVLDNEMPHLSGLELCDRLKGNAATRGIPILLATAGAIDMSLIHRADAFLAKPFKTELLFSFIDRLLGRAPAPEALPPIRKDR